MQTQMALTAGELKPVAFRRKGSRKVLRKDGFADAAAMIGKVEPGDEISGITNGQFSLVDILHHLLTETGPADVVIATWTMGVYDAEKAYAFAGEKLIKSIRFIVDPSMFCRRPELASVLVKGFGPESFRAVNSHAKFMTVRGADLALCVRSSMNLNENKRLESFDISACDEMTAFYEGVADEIWQKVNEGNRSQSHSVFEDLLLVESIKNPKRTNPFLAQG